jgi:tyrosyl-tRNA synthetase
MENIFEELKFRELIFQVSNEKELQKKLKEEKVTFYIGFDPTAPSLHFGHLLLIVTMLRFLKFSHKPIALIGETTALIGDPSGKIKERPLLEPSLVEEFAEKIKAQLEKFLGNEVEILSNKEWLSNLDLISFLRDYGKNIQVAQMLNKEAVKNRISKEGISFCEFSYMVLQAIDFLELKKRKNCDLQVGGSDQWGNICLGIDLVKKVLNVEVFGLTLPLLTLRGKKLGKTESGTIFLDPKLTTPYQFYQFLFNLDDESSIKFLKWFTFLKKEEILELEKVHKKSPDQRLAQKTLAKLLTEFVHGKKEFERVEKISRALFYNEIRKLKEEEIKEAFFNVPSQKISIEKEIPVLDLLVFGKVALSKSEAKRLINSGAILINDKKITDIHAKIEKKEALYGKYFVIKKGKKSYFLIEC